MHLWNFPEIFLFYLKCLVTYTTFSTSDGKSVEVNSTAGGIQQAKELFYLTNTAYKNPDYRLV